MKDDIKLPPLPYPQIPGNYYTAEDMEEFALTAIKADRQRKGEPDFFTYVINGNHRGISETEPPADSYDEGTLRALYATPQPAEPRVDFDDSRVQQVYEIICGDNHPPVGEHWDGYVSRLIVDAMFSGEPVEPEG